VQRKMGPVASPYRTPQTLGGVPRSDAALAASSGRTATTKSMGKGSTQHQHLVQTEVPKKLLEEWLALWSEHYELGEKLRVTLRPRRAGSDVLELGLYGGHGQKPAHGPFDPNKDRPPPRNRSGRRPTTLVSQCNALIHQSCPATNIPVAFCHWELSKPPDRSVFQFYWAGIPLSARS